MDSILPSLDNVRVMIDIFSNRVRALNVFMLNARSIRNKIEEIRQMFSGTNIHVILVTETWLNADIPSTMVSIPGYVLYRNDRVDRIGGGVAVYVRGGLRVKRIACSSSSPIEFLCIEVDTGIEKCALTIVYCPPRCFNPVNIIEFEECMFRLSSQYHKIVVGGDFNVDLLRSDNISNTFRGLLQSMCLNVINNLPTYFNTSNPSLLDLLLISDTDDVIWQNQLSSPSIFDHDFLFLAYNMAINTIGRPMVYTYRDYNNIDSANLFQECATLPWDNILSTPFVDDQVYLFNSFVTHLHDEHVPLRSKVSSPADCPWITHHIKVLITKREHLYLRYKRNRTDLARNLYKIARNKVTSAIRAAKRQYYGRKLNPSFSSSVLWRNLRQAGVHNRGYTSECVIDPEVLNAHFVTGHRSSVSPSTNNQVSRDEDDVQGFAFRCVSTDEMLNAIYAIKSNAVGPDLLNPRFIKLLLPMVNPYLLHILNTALASSTFPAAWKIAKVLPIAKKANPEEPGDFRPISILPFLAKVLEKLIYWQILDYLQANCMLTKWQSGFRSGHSCSTALLKVTTDIRTALNDDMVSVLVLLDFSKAFDMVSHACLLSKLTERYRFLTSAASLIESFLTNRWQSVVLNDGQSSPLPLVSGVPQGSILGPLLFSVYINDLPDVVLDAKMHLYADDVQLYLSRPVGLMEDCIERLNCDLTRIYNWSVLNGLLLNPHKSRSILFHRIPADILCPPNINLNGILIPYVNRVKDLGVVLGYRMECCGYVDSMLHKIYGGLRRLRLSADILPRVIRLMLVKSLIIPFFLYGRLVFPQLDSICERRIEVAFNDCIRFIFGLRRFEHVTPFKSSILGCSLDTYLKRTYLNFLFKLITTGEPSYLLEHINFLNSRRGRILSIPLFQKLVFERSYFVQTFRLWNSLPHNVQSAGTVGAFRRHLCTISNLD